MGAVCFLIATIIFAVATFGGSIGEISLIAAGLMFTAAGLLLVSIGKGTWPG